MVSKLRTTILCMCAVLLLAVLAMPDLAEANGYNVRRAASVTKVAQYANNALVNNLTFDYSKDHVEPDIASLPQDSTETLTIKIGYGLIITNDDAVRGDTGGNFVIWCSSKNDDNYDVNCQETADTNNPKATVSNKDGVGIITITIGKTAQSFAVAGVRVDASTLDLEDEVTASVTSTTDATSVGLGGGSDGGGVSGVVGTVTAGLKVTAEKDADLACSAVKPKPSITVAEAFVGAWGPTNLEADTGGDDMQTASVRIVLDNLPDDAKVEWPGSVNSYVDVDPSGDTDNRVNGMLKMDSAESSSSGKVVVYNYTQVAARGDKDDPDTKNVDESKTILFSDKENAVARSFKIVPGDKTAFTGDATLDISAALFPAASRGTDGEKLNLGSELSFEHPLQAPEEGKGEDWLVISECVTYLLYPFVTCGSSAGWTTGISVSNTTADGNIFGAFDETAEQAGSVVMYGFPRGQTEPAEGESVEPVVHTLTSKLIAGDTITEDCSNTTMAGMEGYAIIRAGFQHARGMGFVMGLFEGGSVIDVTHGYMAEVIHDPSTRSDAIN